MENTPDKSMRDDTDDRTNGQFSADNGFMQTLVPRVNEDLKDTIAEKKAPVVAAARHRRDAKPLPPQPPKADEKYVVESELGDGGMGIVYSVRDTRCRRKVAMKKMRDELRFEEGLVSRFIAEAQIAAQLEHPSVIPVYELGESETGTPFYTMKLVRGLTLQTIIDEIADGNRRYISRYSLGRLLNMYRKLCEAVAYAHSRGVIHRDLKPENVMIGAYGEVMLVDWGLAKILDKEDRPVMPDFRGDGDQEAVDIPAQVSVLPELKLEDSIHTINIEQSIYGQPKGSPYYMPPEQAKGALNEINTRSDIYALGGILYAIISLRTPVDGKSLPLILSKIEHGEITDPLTFNDTDTFPHCAGGKIPGSLSKIAMKALEIDQADRYQTVIELLDDIDTSMGNADMTTSGNFGFLAGLPAARRRKTLISGGLILLAVVIFCGIFAVIKMNKKLSLASTLLQSSAPSSATGKGAMVTLLERTRDKLARANPNQSNMRFDYRIDHNDISLVLEGNTQLANIEALRELPLTHLNLRNTIIRDLAPLRGKALKSLNLALTPISDIGTLGAPGALHLDISDTRVSDFSSLVGTQTTSLNISGLPPADLRILQSIALRRLVVDSAQLGEINQQVLGKLEHLGIRDAKPDDITRLPVTALTSLELQGRAITDLNPLSRLKLRDLALISTRVGDLGPLREMPLSTLIIHRGVVSDLEPLTAIPLIELRIEKCDHVADLSVVSRMPYLRKLLIPEHLGNIDYLRVVTHLNVLANNLSDYENDMTPVEFWKKYDQK